MKNNIHGAMPGVVTPAGAPGAFNTEAFDSNTINQLYSATDGIQRKATMQYLISTPTPDKAAILAALTKPIDPPDLFGIRSLTTKKRPHIQEIRDLGLGDFHVYTNNKPVYCKDLAAVQAFAKKLGVTK